MALDRQGQNLTRAENAICSPTAAWFVSLENEISYLWVVTKLRLVVEDV
jgi:hypothetical protein